MTQRCPGTREVVVWGSGTPLREFLHVDDLADACLFLMRRYDGVGHINVGTGEDLSIRALAELIREVVYPEAVLTFDASKPDGMPRKLLDVTRLHTLGWRHRIDLRDGITGTYRWFLEHQDTARLTSVAAAILNPAPQSTAGYRRRPASWRSVPATKRGL